MTFQLETPRLTLRQFCHEDLEPFLAYRNDPLVSRFQGWKVPYSRECGEDFLGKMTHVTPGTPGEWMQVAIVPKDSVSNGTGLMIGDVAFHITKSNPSMAYIGYTLSRSAWGRGYASEAVSGLVGYLFGYHNLHRLVAECDTKNEASIRLLERLGFRREAHYIESYWLEDEAMWGSEYLYALLKREWKLR